MDSESKRAFEERLSALDTAGLSPQETISTRTLLAPGGVPGEPADRSRPPPRPLLSSLPRISLALAQERKAAPRGARGRGPDLSIEGLLGAGGMGKVHRARQHSLCREVAVKVLRDGATEGLADALLSEAVLTGFLGHPGIIPVHALGTDDNGSPVLVMKRVDGVTWQALLDDDDHPAWADWEDRASDRLLVHLEILAQVCDAVHFAHSVGVVHRDIKPENVMLGRFGEVYLVDWGVAVHTAADTSPALAGTPAYMAPEMASEDAIDCRSDVYLLGASLHHVLTGSPRHRGRSLPEVLRNAFASEPFRYDDEVPSLLADLCNAATARSPDARPADALAFRARLRDFQRFRSSQTICEAAWARLEQLREVMDGGGESPEPTAIAAHRLAAEAQFGLERALEEWSENERALRGRRECALLQVELYLRRRDAPMAKALLTSVADAPADLARRCDSLERELAAEDEKQERLRALERDLDESVGRGARGAAAVLLFLLGASIGAYALFQEGSLGALTQAQAFAFVVVVLVVVSAGMLYKREDLRASALNRRGAALALLTIGLMLCNRGIGWANDVPLRQIFTLDTLLLAGCAGAIAINLFRWAGYLVPIFVATAAVLTVAPAEVAPPIFLFGTLSAFGLALVLWR